MADAKPDLNITARTALGSAAVLVALSLTIPAVGSPLPLLALSLLLAITAGAIYLWGAEAPLLAAVVITPLIPNSTDGFAAGALGGYGGDIRAALLIFLVGVFLACFSRGLPSLPSTLVGVVGSLLAIAGAGAFAAVINADGPSELIAELSPGVGQPLIYALLIVAVVAAVQSREGARERLLAAICVAIFGQTLIVLAEFATGAAFDASRGVTRAQGTVGANFLSAMAMVAFFAGLSLQSGAVHLRLKLLGSGAAAAALLILLLATTRGGLAGVLIGIAYVVLTGVSRRARLAIVGAGVALLMAGALIGPLADIWSDRLEARGGVSGFDRTATWVSGVRMGIDDPVSGLGSIGVQEGVVEVPRYRDTPVGYTSVVPHNTWILALAQGGVASLIASLVFSAFVGLAIWRRPRRGSLPDRFLVAGLLALVAVTLINNLFTHPEVMLPGLVLLTIMAGRVPAARERELSG